MEALYQGGLYAEANVQAEWTLSWSPTSAFQSWQALFYLFFTQLELKSVTAEVITEWMDKWEVGSAECVRLILSGWGNAEMITKRAETVQQCLPQSFLTAETLLHLGLLFRDISLWERAR